MHRFDEINISCIRSNLEDIVQVKKKVLGFINTLMVEDVKICEFACKKLMEFVIEERKRNDIQFTFSMNPKQLYAKYMTENIISMMLRGVYRTKVLPDDKFLDLLAQMLYSPTEEGIREIKDFMKSLYTKDLKRYAQVNVAALVKLVLKNDTNMLATIKEYFIGVSECTLNQIVEIIEGRRSA